MSEWIKQVRTTNVRLIMNWRELIQALWRHRWCREFIILVQSIGLDVIKKRFYVFLYSHKNGFLTFVKIFLTSFYLLKKLT